MNHIYNCHTHIFNIDHAPARFLQGFAAKRIANIAWALLQLPTGRRIASWLLSRVKNPNVSKYASFVYVGTMKSQNHVFRDLRSNYSKQDRFVILSLNMDFMGAGKANEAYAHQVYELKRVKKNNLNTCLPFYSVDPRAGSIYENAFMARDHIENKGFAGIKIYPALGFYPFDVDMEETYKFAAGYNVPIMTHCTRVGSYYLGKITPEMIKPASFCPHASNWPKSYDTVDFPLKKNLTKNALFCDYFSHPYNYARVLEVYPDLKICFAHAGDDPEIKKARTVESHESWFTQIKYLIETYPNVYTDISFTLSEKDIFEDLYEAIADSRYGHRILFGTDYFMTLMKKKEKPLVNDFRRFLYSKSDGDKLWYAITVKNPETYLESAFYKP